MSETTPLLVTAGEPAGVGAELIIRTLGAVCGSEENNFPPMLVVADAGLMQRAALRVGYCQTDIDGLFSVHTSISDYLQTNRLSSELAILHTPMPLVESLGEPNVENAPYILNTLEIAAEHCLSGVAAGMVTGPLHKGIINQSLAGTGKAFSGHTEYLAALSGTPKVVMMLATEAFRVALVTTHIPLKDVATAITTQNLIATLEILQRELKNTFAIPDPQILVCGLNPHAGEGGYLGMEEIDTIVPALQLCRQQGMDLIGPLPADTAFTQDNIANCDAILAMYHDQGLPVLKHAGFGKAINITLGLPFIRTSVDHGTALDIAGTGKANPASMRLALETAARLVNARRFAA